MVQRVQYCFWALQGYNVPALRKTIRARDCVSCSQIFLRAGNNPVVLKNSTEHAEPLFIALMYFNLT